MASPTIVDAAQRVTKVAGKKRNWIKSAIGHPGALKTKAKAAGETTREFASQHASDSGKTGAQARLAETLMGMNKKPKGKLHYPNSK